MCRRGMRSALLLLLSAASAFQPPSHVRARRADVRARLQPVDAFWESFVVLQMPATQAALLASAVDVVSQAIVPHEPLGPPENLPRAALRHQNRRRGVDVRGAAAFGFLASAGCEYFDVGTNEGVLFGLACLYDAARNEVARLREIDRCTSELAQLVRELRRTAHAPSGDFDGRAEAAEVALAELSRRVRPQAP